MTDTVMVRSRKKDHEQILVEDFFIAATYNGCPPEPEKFPGRAPYFLR
jgi:hypothetical protein